MTGNQQEQPSKTFADRYLLAQFENGGVIVNLATGNYFQVNRSAASVCDALIATNDKDDAELVVARHLGLSPQQAKQITATVMDGLETPVVLGLPQGSYHFFATTDGYELRHNDRRVLEICQSDKRIHLPPDAPVPPIAQLELYVQALAPKLLFQAGISVLHASACFVAGRGIAFAGISGAGKTTTARAFVEEGATLLSEDLLVLSPGQRPGAAVLGGESLIREWAKGVADRLSRSDSRSVPFPGILVNAIDGPSVPIDRLLLLDRGRRSGTQFITRPLDHHEGLAALLMHYFLGAGEPAACRRFIQTATEILRAVKTQEATAPKGTDLLRAAARAYMSSWTS